MREKATTLFSPGSSFLFLLSLFSQKTAVLNRTAAVSFPDFPLIF
jgi:hypothetical protein